MTPQAPAALTLGSSPDEIAALDESAAAFLAAHVPADTTVTDLAPEFSKLAAPWAPPACPDRGIYDKVGGTHFMVMSATGAR